MVNDIREEAKEKEEGPAPDALHHHGMLDADASAEAPFEEHEFDTVRFIGNNDEDKGVGRLCIRERDIVWRGRDELVIPFKHVSLSALADCPDKYESPLSQCLYLQIDTGDNDDDDYASEEEEELREVHMFSSSAEDLEAMFKAMCDGALRNPDSDAEEEQGHMFFDMESAVMGSFDDTLTITDEDR
ncbi:hypothetical protein M9435_006555 [Picochlorum sp. BPE23]|nr:hypothetical protein M9435_006555 [Picochlorum sp. BPE23]